MPQLRQPFGLKPSLPEQDRSGNQTGLPVQIINNSFAWEQLDPILIPNAEGVVLNPSSLSGSTAGDLYEVHFTIVNVDGANAVTVSLGIDIGAGGGLAAAEYFIRSEVVPAPGALDERVLLLAGNDTIRAVASAANDAAIHWRIKKVR